MGRITIFSVDDCSNCLLVKKAFRNRGIPVTEICLSNHPHRRLDMLKLSNQISLPQIFINSTHLGGAEDGLKLLDSWDRNGQGRTPLEVYKTFVAHAADPSDARLLPAKEAPVVTIHPPSRTATVIKIPMSADADAGHVQKISVLDFTELLKRIVPRRELRYNMTIYKNAFKGCEFVDSLIDEFSLQRDQAVAFAQTLQTDHHILQHVVNDHSFQDTDSLFFRLHCDQTPNVLNSYRAWTESVDPDSMALVNRLKKQLFKILRDHTDDSTGKVDYKKAFFHKDFPAFDEAVCELQGVDFGNMPYATKLAFSINVYNIMVKFGFAKVGIGASDLGRNAFFNNVGFNLGGHFLTFRDLENGVLRGNRKAPNSLSRQFGPNDDRLKLVMPIVDCRIHFGLTCGASSCPAMHSFTSDCIDEELRIAAEIFCNDNSNVRVEGNILHLSKMFSWYAEDFGGIGTGTAKTVLEYLRGSKAAALRDLIAGGTVKVKYAKYDWATDASDFIPFSGSAVKSDESRLNLSPLHSNRSQLESQMRQTYAPNL